MSPPPVRGPTVKGSISGRPRASSAGGQVPSQSVHRHTSTSQWSEEPQRRDELRGEVPAEAGEQRGGHAGKIEWWHERRLREGTKWTGKGRQPPPAPTAQRVPIDAQRRGQLACPPSRRTLLHRRDQCHHRGKPDLATKKTQRGRCRPRATAIHGTTETEAPPVLLIQTKRNPARLAAKPR